jgi:hypothetical protein
LFIPVRTPIRNIEKKARKKKAEAMPIEINISEKLSFVPAVNRNKKKLCANVIMKFKTSNQDAVPKIGQFSFMRETVFLGLKKS